MKSIKVFLVSFIKMIRLHQWVKNLLIFLPILLAGVTSHSSFLLTLKGFIAFSLIASSFYVFNDLNDIHEDREHPEKKNRPIAANEVSKLLAKFCFLILFISGISISLSLNIEFQSTIVAYCLLNILYSRHLKYYAILDLLVVTSFYTIRLIGGALLNNLVISNWLITFSVFFFLFLAIIKRRVELYNSDKVNINAGKYRKEDMPFLSQLSVFSGLISVLVICLYIDSRSAEIIYGHPQYLWLLPIFMLYWIIEILYKTERNMVGYDPVIYALKNPTTYICALIFMCVMFISSLD